MTTERIDGRTVLQHLRTDAHGYDRITRGIDPELLHAMDHRALRRRNAETHTHSEKTIGANRG